MKRYFTTMLALFVLALFAVPSFAATVATGGVDGFYNNGLFNTFKAYVEKSSRGEVELERYSDDGTDGTISNLELVDSGEADLAFVQLGGTALAKYPNVSIIGIFGYEVAHLVVPKGSKLDDCGDLEKKGNEWKIGVNTMSGSNVTMDVMTKVDDDYTNIIRIETLDSLEAEMSFNSGEIDAFFFVSTPGSGSVGSFNQGGYEFLDCWDMDFDDFDVNKKQLYQKTKMKKKYGYPNNFKTFSVPGVIVANKAYIKENRKELRAFMKGTKQTYATIKQQKKFTFYPGD
jgi:TRAP-type uncharacterized transport system substrate-binding protein